MTAKPVLSILPILTIPWILFPALVAIGLRPVDSVAVALMGHSVGVSFGAVGTPIVPQIASTGFDGLQLVHATGEHLRKTMVGCLIYSTLGGLVAWGLAGLQGAMLFSERRFRNENHCF